MDDLLGRMKLTALFLYQNHGQNIKTTLIKTSVKVKVKNVYQTLIKQPQTSSRVLTHGGFPSNARAWDIQLKRPVGHSPCTRICRYMDVRNRQKESQHSVPCERTLLQLWSTIWHAVMIPLRNVYSGMQMSTCCRYSLCVGKHTIQQICNTIKFISTFIHVSNYYTFIEASVGQRCFCF